MQVNVKIDTLGLVQQTTKAQKNLVYSVVQGINATARRIQDAQRKNLEDHFTLRSNTKAFMLRNVAIIKPFASVNQGRLYAEVAVGQRNKLLLGGYERGDERKPFKGHMIAQPVVGGPARPNFKDEVPQAFTFKGMALKAKNGRAIRTGNNNTFSIRGVGVFQRTGKARDDVRLVYSFVESQRLPAKLRWKLTAQDIANKWLNEYVTQAYLKSLK